MVVRKAVDMCNKLNVPILGLVQNMAWLKCPDCGDVIYPFGNSEGERIARDMGIPHLLDLPIDPEISARCDAGTIEDYASNPLFDRIDLITNGLMAVKYARNTGVCDASDAPCRQ